MEIVIAFMGKVTATTTPLFFQSKLLCISLLYLFTTLFLAFYHSLSPTKCLFRSSPFDPIQKPLFFYPPSYGEHKYAIPTDRSSCSSPVFFSGMMSYQLFFCSSFGFNDCFSDFGLKGIGFCDQIMEWWWRRSIICVRILQHFYRL